MAKLVRRRCIQPSSWQDFATTAGNYILAFENHFIAGRHGEDGVQLNLSHRTHTWTSFVEQENPIGHCLSRDSEAGMLSIDTSLLDCVVRVELLSDGERACVPDCQGGKLVETSAVEMIETWQDLQFQARQCLPLRSRTQFASLPPLSPTGSWKMTTKQIPNLIVQVCHRQVPGASKRLQTSMLQASLDSANDVDSDEVFWDSRPDWLERRMTERRLDYNGGGLPAELLEGLPGFYCVMNTSKQGFGRIRWGTNLEDLQESTDVPVTRVTRAHPAHGFLMLCWKVNCLATTMAHGCSGLDRTVICRGTVPHTMRPRRTRAPPCSPVLPALCGW